MKHDGKNRANVSWFSGKYHGRINEKISRKTAKKISINATAGKGHNRKIIRV